MKKDREMTDSTSKDKPRFQVVIMEPRLKALVVDDDRVSRTVISELLAQQNVEVTESSNGLDAIFDLHERQPDFIVLDHHMPVVSGEKVYAAIRRRPMFEDIPVIVLSGTLDMSVVKLFLQHGKPEFLVKPVDPARLADLLSAIRKAKSGKEETPGRSSE